jgi:hypothetical protein
VKVRLSVVDRRDPCAYLRWAGRSRCLRRDDAAPGMVLARVSEDRQPHLNQAPGFSTVRRKPIGLRASGIAVQELEVTIVFLPTPI